MNAGRNEPCPCGSGKKFKHCCEKSASTVATRGPAVLVAIVVLAGTAALVAALNRAPRPTPQTPAVAQPMQASTPAAATTTNGPSAETPPPGKVWSPEHGHWHDASAINTANSIRVEASNLGQNVRVEA